MTRDEMVAALATAEYGADEQVKLDDGRLVRCRVEIDDSTTVNDYDADGRVEWSRDNDYGPVRPSDFTGRARIMTRDHRSSLWWEPPSPEMIGTVWDDATMRAEESRIRDLLEYGFRGVVLELCDGTDAYGRPVVVDVASLWGIEWDADTSYVESVVSDLLSELQVPLALLR